MISLINLFESILYSDNLNFVNKIISTFSKQEKKFMGPRSFYDPSEFRRVLIDNKTPVAYFEARFMKSGDSAKINIGVNSKYRKAGYMKMLFNNCISELKNLGIVRLLSSVHEENIPSLEFMKKMKFKEINDKKQLELYRFTDSDHRYFVLEI